MEYLAKAFHAGVTYEAHVTVTGLRLGLEPRFSTSLCYVNDVVEILGEQCSEVVQMMLLDDACDQWAWEFDES
jgi:hypothetical protein